VSTSLLSLFFEDDEDDEDEAEEDEDGDRRLGLIAAFT
jgi:hypothetical protein